MLFRGDMMGAAQSLLDELDAAFSNGTSKKRNDLLRRITDLFLDHAHGFGPAHIELFETVFALLVAKIERQALAELSQKLAPESKTPIGLIKDLACHEDIAVAAPVLKRSLKLADPDLVKIAQTNSQDHLVAIAGRRQVSEWVSDALIERGNSKVLSTVAGNAGARFSLGGYSKLAGKAEQDADIAQALVVRRDIAPDVLRQLVEKAAQAVQHKLMASTDPRVQERVRPIMQAITRQMAGANAALGTGQAVSPASQKPKLMESAEAGKFNESVEALAAVSELPPDVIKRLMSKKESDRLLIVCKASDLLWPTVRSLLGMAIGVNPANAKKFQPYLDQYLKITQQDAQRVMRYVRTLAGKGASGNELVNGLKL
jgi:uncharacterized protein (DUF2336 family)